MKQRIFTIIFILFTFNIFAQNRINQKYVDSLKSIIDTISDNRHKIDVYKNIALHCYDINDIIKYSDTIETIALKINSELGLGQAASLRSWAYSMSEKNDSAITYTLKGLTHYYKIDSNNLIIGSLIQLGGTYANTLDYNESLKSFQKAYYICTEEEDSTRLDEILIYIGYNYTAMELYNMALEKLNEGLEIAKKNKNQRLINQAKISIVETYKNLYLKTKDKNYLNEALKIASEVKDILKPEKDIVSYLNFLAIYPATLVEKAKISSASENKKILSEALKCTDEGIKIINEGDYSIFSTHIMSSKAIILMEMGRFEETKRIIQKLEEEHCTDFDKHNILELKIDYYRKTKNWEKISSLMDSKLRMSYTKFNLEFAMKSEKDKVIGHYSNVIDKMDKEKNERNKHFKVMRRYNLIINILLFIITGLGIVQITYTIINYKKTRKTNEELVTQNNELKSINYDLQSMQSEIKSQYDEIVTQTEMLGNQRTKLNEYNKFLIKSISMAEKIQRALVPCENILNQIFKDAMVYWKPLDIVSGDFYWAGNCCHKKYLIIADCTGHGVPGALVSMLGISILNDLLSEFQERNAAEILEIFKAKFIKILSLNGKEIDDGMDLALIVSYSDTIEYAGANRPLIMVRDGELTEFKPDKLCIGKNQYKEHLKFTNHVIATKPGDVFYAYSDGITDQFGGEDGHTKFSPKQAKTMLQEIAQQPFARQKKIIETRIIEWMNVKFYDYETVPQLDDQLLIGVRIV